MINKISIPKQVNNGPANKKGPQEGGYLNPQDKKVTTKKKAFEGFQAMKDKRYNDVMSHEQAHLSAAKHLAASGIHLDYDSNGVVSGGHVMINVPQAGTKGMSKKKLEQIKTDAGIAREAAAAPSSLGGDAGKLSDADKAIISRASSVMSVTNGILQQKKCECQGCDSCKGLGNRLNISG